MDDLREYHERRAMRGDHYSRDGAMSFHNTLRSAGPELRKSPTWTALATIQRLLDEGRYLAALCQAEEAFAACIITSTQLKVVEYQCEGRVA